MNKRIRELMVKCNYVVDGTCDISREQKFAELLVRECMELTKQCSTGPGIHDLFADEIIAEHFGVE